MLRTLGYRIPAQHVDSLLGQVVAYPFDTAFADAWNRIPPQRTAGGHPYRVPYRQLQTGLSAVHNRPVHVIDGWQLSGDDKARGLHGMIVASGAIDPFHLATCLRTFEKQLRGGEDRNALAPLLGAPDLTRAFSADIDTAPSGTATAPGWLFDCAVWGIMARLTFRPLRLEDNRRGMRLRMDTDGGLLAWDEPLANRWEIKDRDAWIGYAMLRIQANIITLPLIPDLAVVFDAHLSRISDQWRGCKTAWIERDNPDHALLRVPVRHRKPARDGDPWSTEVANHAAAIARACSMESLDLDQDLPAEPGPVRPLVPGPRIHPIGKGPGARVMLRLAEHIEATCPQLQPLTWERVREAKIRTPRRQVLGTPAKPAKTTLAVTPDIIQSAAEATSHGRIRLLCLYATSDARHRMATQLQALSPAAAPALDDYIAEVNPGLGVSFHHVPDLLRHGQHDRTAHLDPLKTTIDQEPGRVLAWVETEYDPRTGSPVDDAKNPLRRMLAALHVPAQFLATHPADAPPPRKRKQLTDSVDADYPAAAAAQDLLLRTAGILHPAMTADMLHGFLDHTPHPSVHLVGLHARRQHAASVGSAPKLVLIATAVQAHADPDIPWTVTMWSDTARTWIPQPHGIADFHAGSIGCTQRGRGGDKAVQTRFDTEAILDALPAGPVVIFVDTTATRTIWPGLQNLHFADGPLPATNLSADRDVAIVRCNTGREVPRPVDRKGGGQPRNDHRQPAAPDHYVYRLPSTGIWLYPKSSRPYRQKGGAIGAHYTPWTLPEELRHLLREDWHAYTGTEFAIPQAGPWSEVDLVTLAARLCEYTITWDDRTLAPLPLHLATRADLTHPDYRGDDDDT
jgi:hypothetical protein